MKEVLLTIDFRDPTDKFWWDSGIKNETHSYDPEKQTIHDLVMEICEDAGMELTYKGKPRGNVYRDSKDGSSRKVGYMYRGKGEIQDRSMVRPVMVFWDVWVEIKGVEKFEIVDIDR
jgi:hypothetical protein